MCVRSSVCARGSVLSELPLKILWEGAVLKVNLLLLSSVQEPVFPWCWNGLLWLWLSIDEVFGW